MDKYFNFFLNILFNACLYLLSSCFMIASVPREGCFLKAKAGSQEMNFQYTTGRRDIDVAINIELGALKQMFGQNPVFYLVRMNNAFATTQYFQHPPGIYPTPGQPVTGTVALGTELLEKEMFQSKSGQGFNIPAILAHEFGHLVQFQMGNNMPSTKLKELQADALSGWYMARRKYFVPTDLVEALDGFFRMGDTNFRSPGHHGTPNERRAAIKWGMDNATRFANFFDAYKQSFQWIEATFQSNGESEALSNSDQLARKANFGMPEGFTPETIPVRTPFGDCNNCGSFGEILKQIWLSMEQQFSNVKDSIHKGSGILNLPGMRAEIINNEYWLTMESNDYHLLNNQFLNFKEMVLLIFGKFDDSPYVFKIGDEEGIEITSNRDFKIAVVCSKNLHKKSILRIMFSRK